MGSGLHWEHNDLRGKRNLLQVHSLLLTRQLRSMASLLPQLMSSCWDNSAKELSTGRAQQGLLHGVLQGSIQAQTLQVQCVMPLCRMWRMTGMLGAIMGPDNVLHLREWLAVSVVRPSMDVTEKMGCWVLDSPVITMQQLVISTISTRTSNVTPKVINYKLCHSKIIIQYVRLGFSEQQLQLRNWMLLMEVQRT